MQAYFVRVKESRQVVGIYTAKSLATLREIVDECADPADCEALPVGEGGIFQPASVSCQFPQRDTGDPDYDLIEEDQDPFANARFTEVWSGIVRDAKQWKSLG